MVQLEALCSALTLNVTKSASTDSQFSFFEILAFEDRPMPSIAEMGLNQSSAGQSCGKPQVFDWWPAEQQYLNLTSRGHINMSHTENATAAAASVHPLVPLLLYSDRHFSSSSPYSQPISAAAAAAAAAAQQAYAQSEQHMCYHSNSASSRQPVKKPLNAFMLYMKEMRHKVLQEGQERESAAINRILGRRWHALSRSEQSKYYDLAQKERLLHMQLYPGWSARDNYGKRKKKQSQQTSGNSSSWTLNAG